MQKSLKISKNTLVIDEQKYQNHLGSNGTKVSKLSTKIVFLLKVYG